MIIIANRRVNYKLYGLFPLLISVVPILTSTVESNPLSWTAISASTVLFMMGILMLLFLKRTSLIQFDPGAGTILIHPSSQTVILPISNVLSINVVSSYSMNSSLLLSPYTGYELVITQHNKITKVPFIILDRQKDNLRNYAILKLRIAELRRDRSTYST
jgi:hypothetical protein